VTGYLCRKFHRLRGRHRCKLGADCGGHNSERGRPHLPGEPIGASPRSESPCFPSRRNDDEPGVRSPILSACPAIPSSALMPGPPAGACRCIYAQYIYDAGVRMGSGETRIEPPEARNRLRRRGAAVRGLHPSPGGFPAIVWRGTDRRDWAGQGTAPDGDLHAARHSDQDHLSTEG
jgi:hypothetical protein